MRYVITIFLFAACLVACGNRGKASKGQTPPPPVRYGFKIVNSYPHDTGAYTQGLFWHEGALYESTGEYGHSTLRSTEFATGEVKRSIALSNEYFAEGAVFFAGKIYQLTWFEEKCFVYDVDTFEGAGEFSYKGQGWGLATDGEKLYMSDGSANIIVRDPATFEAKGSIVVRNEGRPVQHINELEWIDGKIWANVYMTNEIVIIDPSDGHIEGIIDFTGIESQLALTPSTDVMNGIAYDEATGRIFVTGKRWNKLFEIEIFKK